ncbi:MAG: hypothetical protein COW67_10890 [Flavobacteriales bacterium CG18_big_fil_WC_8_21_14_2_50_32_9]|nr:MAG: hypothetical protein COW67_10890 [Flavobacteriales bacterium CG18_big_fil_WC_8_21_14_2_50_32_9]
MFDTFGNKVRIRRTPETEEKGLADKEGEVYGHTTPSMMDFEIVGNLKEDFAINVYFEDLSESFWFAEELVEYLNNGQGTEITLDGIDKKWIKGDNGEWFEEDTSPTWEKNKAEQNQSESKDWWKFCKKNK